jgi:uncharacterized protein YjbJ (UPF0337 family)
VNAVNPESVAEGGAAMGTEGTFDKATGKVKEEAGRLTDNEEMEAEGQTDQAKGEVKNKIDDVSDTVKDAFD